MTRSRRWLATALLASLCGSIALGAGILGGRHHVPYLDGWLFDYALYLRHASEPPGTKDNPVAVVGIDGRSLEDDRLSSAPRALMGPIWGALIRILRQAGAEVVAFDLLLSYTGNHLVTDFDREFLATLAHERGHVVLGRSAGSLPARPYLAALRFDESSLGFLEIAPEADGVVRKLPVTVAESASLGLAAAAVAKLKPKPASPSVPFTPLRHLEATPTYSLIDVLNCAQRRPEELQQAFSGRIVFVGSTLPEEDRWISSGRFLPAPTAGSSDSACGLHRLAESLPGAGTVPGVHIHAAAAGLMLSGDTLTQAAPAVSALLPSIAAGLGAVIGFALRPWLILAALAAAAAGLFGTQFLQLLNGTLLPSGPGILALVMSTLLAYAVRYTVSERQRIWVQKAFSHYLAPDLVRRLADDRSALRLQGETREISVMFADLSGFTALSERTTPEELVRLSNRYLGFIANAVQSSRGYVDKFIGDAVMALWGAPVADNEHSLHAVEAAIAAVLAVEHHREPSETDSKPLFRVKIGLHSGPAVVGNVGTRQRLNYTAIGEAVNIASRLEGLTGLYHCPILIGDATADRVRSQFLLREIDSVQVKGKSAPVTIFEPVCRLSEATNEMKAAVNHYHQALALYRSAKFSAAEAAWSALASEVDHPGPEQTMAARARQLADTPAPDDWNGVWHMTTK